MLALYRRALRLRRAEPALAGSERLTWCPCRPGILCYQRGDGAASITVLVNLSAEPVPLPSHETVLITSAPLAGGLLPSDTAAWLR